MSERSLGKRGSELQHQPALDGLRAVAVIAVLLFHGGVSWAQGGYLGVEAFFVLSGFLITSLLLAEWRKDLKIHLGDFWARRARRLLPALFCLIVVTAVYESLKGPALAVPDFAADGLATLFYIANWHQIWTGNGYFEQAALVSPLQHTWSLAIEEQFYLVWPLVLVGLLAVGRRMAGRLRRIGERAVLLPALVVCVAGALASSAEMAWLYHGGAGLDRVYYGTDTRAQGLLAGAALAVVLAMVGSAGTRTPKRWVGGAAAAAGVAGAVVFGLAVASTGSEPSWLFRGGWLGVDIAVLAVIWAAVSPAVRLSPVRVLLSFRPLVAIGLISYGLYLWHFPLFLWMTESTTGMSGAALLALRLAVTLVVSCASYFLIEQPIRRRRLPRPVIRVALPIGTAAALGSVFVASTVLSAPVFVPDPRLSVLPPSLPAAVASATTKTCLHRVPPYNKPVVFHTCPPTNVMIIGDSVGLTLGIEITLNEHIYGALVDNETIEGCSYTVKGESDEEGTGWGRPGKGCASALSHWRMLVAERHPAVVLVEMGYWDEMDWRWGSTAEALGSHAYDVEDTARIEDYARELSAGGSQVVFLSVPLVDPGPWPDGSPAPQASTTRNHEINALLASVAKRAPTKVHFFSIAPYVTPHGVYQVNVDGSVCRMSDGVHFWIGVPSKFEQSACGIKLQEGILEYVRKLVSEHPPSRQKT
ncbi:MAG: acyltransferase family protein [Acidimicrobiales bacterium]